MVTSIAIYDSLYKLKKFEKIVSTALRISLIESLETFPGRESIQLQLNLKNKVFPYFFFISLCVDL